MHDETLSILQKSEKILTCEVHVQTNHDTDRSKDATLSSSDMIVLQYIKEDI